MSSSDDTMKTPSPPSAAQGVPASVATPPQPVPAPATVQQGGTLELREERAVISTERVAAGQVQLRRVVETRTEMVPVQLTRETLVIEVQVGNPAVRLGERVIQPGETVTLVLYDEETTVTVRPFVTQEVQVSKRSVTETQQVPVELGREVLQVQQTGELYVTETGASASLLPERHL